MKKNLFLTVVMLPITALTGNGLAGDAAAGKTKAAAFRHKIYRSVGDICSQSQIPQNGSLTDPFLECA